MASLELALMRAPARAYARACRQPAPSVVPWRRPATIAVVIGTSMAIAATGVADPIVIARSVLVWAFVPVVQLALAWPLLLRRAAGRLPLGAAIDLFFAGHGPWTLWLVGASVWSVVMPVLNRPFHELLVSTMLPGAWTFLIVRGYCESVLGDSARTARRRAIAHQVVSWGVMLTVYGWAVQIWPRALEFAGR